MSRYDFKTPKGKDKYFIIVFCVLLIFYSLYLVLSDNLIDDRELYEINVTLNDNPEFKEYQIKSTTYRNVIFSTKEYSRVFKITGMTYKATDIKPLKLNVSKGDSVKIKIRKYDLNSLNDNTLSNNYNEVYGLSKSGYSFVNLKLRAKLLDEDYKYAYYFMLIGLIILPYAFVKGKPIIKEYQAILAIGIVGILFYFFLR